MGEARDRLKTVAVLEHDSLGIEVRLDSTSKAEHPKRPWFS